jgi:hypothetical protein
VPVSRGGNVVPVIMPPLQVSTDAERCLYPCKFVTRTSNSSLEEYVRRADGLRLRLRFVVLW